MDCTMDSRLRGNDRNGGGFFKWIFIFIVLCVVGIGICYTMEHAQRRHGDLAFTIVDHCNNNPQITMKRKADMRTGIGCEYAPGKWGVLIKDAKGKVVTAFPNKSKCLDDLIRYLTNRGYQ